MRQDQLFALIPTHVPQQPNISCERVSNPGAFVKYNNNSGFVEFDTGEGHRFTPHAFSRFTFDRSGGELMVVDIQGCDDVYTDPQIHTQLGSDYGDGNLGVGGMALFFSTSRYDTLCERLGLLRFSLAPAEHARRQDALEPAASRRVPHAIPRGEGDG